MTTDKRIIILFFAVAVLSVVLSAFIPSPISNWLESFGISVIAGIIGFIFLPQTFPKDEIRSHMKELTGDVGNQLKQIAEDIEREHTNQYIYSAEMNSDKKPQYWLDIIADLDKTNKPVYFVGSEQNSWRKHSDFGYNTALRNKLATRFATLYQDGHDNETEFCLNIIITEESVEQDWIDFLKNVVQLACSEARNHSQQFKDFCFNRINARLLNDPEDKKDVHYSCVWCEDRLVATHYTKARESRGYLTIDIKPDTALRNNYITDLLQLRDLGKQMQLH